jgi:ABC-type nickel/cobalt efflux system permease component RcnA
MLIIISFAVYAVHKLARGNYDLKIFIAVVWLLFLYEMLKMNIDMKNILMNISSILLIILPVVLMILLLRKSLSQPPPHHKEQGSSL